MGRRELHGVRWGRWVVVLAAALVGCEEAASPSADAGASDIVVTAIDASDDAGASDVVVTAIDASDDVASADDLRSDPRNCGARGHVCVSGSAYGTAICVAGECLTRCMPGRALCFASDDACSAQLLTDHRHCGSCGHACLDDQRCEEGRCIPCPTGTSSCDRSPGAGRCSTDVVANDAHCGACGHACPTEQQCVAGLCTTCPVGTGTCESGLRARCSIDLATDPQHCGSCGRACSGDAFCDGGTCRPCPEGFLRCGSTCVDVRRDRSSCGYCGVSCPDDQECSSGRCVYRPCAPGAGRCGGSTTCVSLDEDPDNCGACEAICRNDSLADRTCRGGICNAICRPGATTCAGTAACSVALAFDNAHCGACDVACAAGTRCVSGACVDASVRQIAPLSAAELGRQRPRLRWQRGEGVDGVRLEVCADRPCARVERTVDVTGDEFRPETALSPGVHFWRLFARRGSVFAATPTPTWVFIVPASDGTREVIGYLQDVDGDGLSDDVSAGGEGAHSTVRITASTHPSDPQVLRGSDTREEYTPFGYHRYVENLFVGAVGDIDGDGFGDLLVTSLSFDSAAFPRTTYASLLYLRGGAPVASGRLDNTGYSRTDAEWIQTTFVGDLDGDGYGDAIVQPGRYLTTALTDLSIVPRFGSPGGLTGVAGDAELLSPGVRFGLLAFGDFNGDGASDVVIGYWALGYPAGTAVFTFSRSPGVVSRLGFLPRCDAASADIDSPSGDGPVVSDANADGFDDVSISRSFAGGGRVTWFGGPEWFSGARCTYAPPTP